MKLTGTIFSSILALVALAAPVVDASPVALRAKAGEPSPPRTRIWMAGNTRDEDSDQLLEQKRDEDSSDIFRRCSTEQRDEDSSDIFRKC
ncbi:hypothetical protein GGG16DRAFT_118423 [Schizophyllum commune]